ncbi:MAG TPA: hypothetical protein VMU30_12530 [Bacteroidota bacterium]|nr:hypothetical protein [Bacteroidota bacterium]
MNKIIIVLSVLIFSFVTCALSNNLKADVASADSSNWPGMQIRQILLNFRQTHKLNNLQMDSLVDLFHWQEEYGMVTSSFVSLEGDDSLWNYFLIECKSQGTKNFNYIRFLLRLNDLRWVNVEWSEWLSGEAIESILSNPDIILKNWTLLEKNLQQMVVRILQIDDDDELWSISSRAKAKRLRERLLKIK